jgi:DNA ligase-1
MIKDFPKLYEQSSTGKVKHWQISVVGIVKQISKKDSAMIVVEYGAGDSKIRRSEKVITIGKNLGKSNETSAYDQAVSEAESTWNKKKDKGYVEKLSQLQDEVLLPMLAHRFQERKHDIVFPTYIQPKLDGVRCMAKKIDEKTIKYYSRMGKEYTTLEHLTPDLLKIMVVGQVLDGEIYSHDYTFQEAVSYIKKLRPESKTLLYYVFDIISNETFADRLYNMNHLKTMLGKDSCVKFLETELVATEDRIYVKHNEYVKAGYEGIIIRNVSGLYSLKKRSKDLQKYKEFKDEEFIITGGVSSTGTEVDCVIFNVKNKKGQEFAVRPRGSFEQRKLWLKDIKNLVGKKLTVRYQELTDDGIPRFPVGIGIRNYE